MHSPYEQQIAFGSVIDILEAIGAKYAIWGGVAVAAFGEPRFTQDMDILVVPESILVPQFVKRLQQLHFHVDRIKVAQVVFEGGYFNVIHEPYGIKIDLYGPIEPHFLNMIDSRIRLPFDEAREAYYISATSLVIAKLIAYDDSQSTRHLDDIKTIAQIQRNKLDLQRIDQFATSLELFGVWRSLSNNQ